MSFSHVQGASTGQAGGVTSITVTLGSNPSTGNLVCFSLALGGTISSLSIKDSNSNSYTVTPNSPSTNQSGAGEVYLAYLLSAPANATKTLTASWTTSQPANAWADEFSVSGGSQTFDKDVKANTGTAGTTINTPSITPTNSGSLLYSCAAASGTISAPAAGGTLGSWNGSGGAIQNGDMAEYDLSASSATAVDYTQSSGGWSAMAMAFYVASSGPSVAQTSPTFDQDDSSPGRQALGFYYYDEASLNSVTWQGLGTIVPPPRTYEMDCDTTSRNFDLNTAYMREPEGELPVMAWPGTGVIGTVMPPPLLWDLDCDTTSRYLDQFLAEMQLLDDQDKTPQNFAPVTDWTADYDWQRWLDLSSAPDDIQYEEYYHPAPFFPLFGWDDAGWERWLDTRVVEDEDERELAWPIPAGQVFNAQIDRTADYDWQQSRDTRVVEDEDPTPTSQNFFPPFGWDDAGWERSLDAHVLGDEDERELVWPIPVSQILNLGWDQDGLESRWFDTRVAADEDAPAARPFIPILTWDDLDVAQGSHFNPAAFDAGYFVDDDRSLQAIALQVIAMALQQMLAVPLLGLQSMTLESAELGVKQMVNVNMLGIQEMENDV